MPPETPRTSPPAVGGSVGTLRLHYRDAVDGDVPAVVALVESAYRGDSARSSWTSEADLLGGQRTDPDGVRAVIDTPGSRMLLAEDDGDGRLIACCQLARRADGSAYFGMFAVRPGRHGGGVGGRVMTEAERIAAEEWGAPTMAMTVLAPRSELIAWYERRGYVRTGATEPFPYGDERYGRPVVDDLHFVVLEKELRA